MFIIDQGEKKLIKRTLLDENNSPIPWDRVVDITFNLTIGGNALKSYSRSAGTVKQNGTDVSFEITQEDTNSLPPTIYDLKAVLDVYDDRFSGQMTDTQWEYRFSKIRINADSTEKFDLSIDSGEMQFSVIPAVIPATGGGPEFAPTIGQPVTTANTLSIAFSSVPTSTEYEYQLESDDTVQSNGQSLEVSLSGLTANTTDRIRVRGRNVDGIGPWSEYKSFTTNPDVSINVTNIQRNIDNAVITLENPLGLDVEYERLGIWQNQGNVTEVTISGLAENQSYIFPFRFRNAGGPGPEVNVTFATSEQAPTSAPTISTNSITGSGGNFSRTAVSGADDYELSIGGGGFTSIGLLSTYDITTIDGNTTFSHVVRAVNDGGAGPNSNTLTVLTKPDVAPIVSPIESTGSSITYNMNAIAGDGVVQYFFRQVGDANWEQVQVGENTYSGLPNPNTAYSFEWYASNASGDGPIGTSQFTTSIAVQEPTLDTNSIVNGINNTDGFYIDLVWTGGGPDYEIKLGTEGALTQITGPATSYRFTQLESGQTIQPYIRSKDGTDVSPFVTPGQLQTDIFSEVEESQTNQFTTA